MAVVQPVVENRQQPRPVARNPVVAAEFDGGQIIGRAVAQAGEKIGDYAEQQNQINIRYSEIAARDADNQATLARQRLYYDGDQAFFNQEGRNALNAAPALQAERERIDREALATLRDPLSQRLYRDVATRRQAADNERIFQHLRTEGNRYENSVDEDAMRVAISAASSAYSNPNEILRNIATARDIAARSALRNGLAAEGSPELDIRQRRAAGLVVTAVANRIERVSPGEARAFIQSMGDQIDGETYVRLLDAVEESAAIEEADEGVVEDLVYAGVPPADAAGATPPPQGSSDARRYVNGWAPRRRNGGDNSDVQVDNYISTVSRRLGVSPDAPLSGAQLSRMASEMARIESGDRPSARSVRNNNPGNIEDGAFARAQPGYAGSDGRFARFVTPAAGQAAQVALLHRYVNRGQTSVRSIIEGVPAGGRRVAETRTRQAIVEGGAEIDMPATIERINARGQLPVDDPRHLDFTQRQARIAAATRRHGADRQARAEVEDNMRDLAYTEMNRLGDNYTNYDQLPLAVRQQLTRFPAIEAQLRGAAATNLTAQRVEQERVAAHSPHFLDLLELANGDVNQRHAFRRLDMRTDPNLTFQQRSEFIRQQGEMIREEERERREGPNREAVNVDRVRTYVARVAVEGQFQPAVRTRMSTVQRERFLMLTRRVVERVRARQAEKHDQVTDEELQAIVASEVRPVTVVTQGAFGERRQELPNYQARPTAEANRDRYLRTEVVPPPGVPVGQARAIIEAYRRENAGARPTDEMIVNIYNRRGAR